MLRYCKHFLKFGVEIMFLKIDIKQQTLSISDAPNEPVIKRCLVSTSKFGVGETYNSFKTPRGVHCIRAKIGVNQPINTVFIRRRPTGEIFNTSLQAMNPDRDWMFSVTWDPHGSICGGTLVACRRLAKTGTASSKVTRAAHAPMMPE